MSGTVRITVEVRGDNGVEARDWVEVDAAQYYAWVGMLKGWDPANFIGQTADLMITADGRNGIFPLNEVANADVQINGGTLVTVQSWSPTDPNTVITEVLIAVPEGANIVETVLAKFNERVGDGYATVEDDAVQIDSTTAYTAWKFTV